MYDGIVDYLEIMRLAGVSELEKLPQPKIVTTASSVHNPLPRGEETLARSPSSNSNPSLYPTPTSNLYPCQSGVILPIEKEATIDLALAAPVPEYRLNVDKLRCLAEEVAKCTRCKDLALSRTQTVFGIGNPDADLVFLGEAPGADEDKQGEPFVGRAGQLLTDIITKGMKLRREDVYICNILRCRPPGNRNPMPDEAAHCRPFLDQTLEIIKPKFICCLGAVAAKNLLASEQTIGAMRGKIWKYNGIQVICTYHPAYLLRNPSAKKDTWEDIQMLMREMGLH